MFLASSFISDYLMEKTFFWKKILLSYLERERNGGRQRGKHWLVVSRMPPTADLASNPGMCPDWELNQWHLGLQDNAQTPSHTSQGRKDFYIYQKTLQSISKHLGIKVRESHRCDHQIWYHLVLGKEIKPKENLIYCYTGYKLICRV